MNRPIAHDPNALLDYTVDWAPWLEDGETISTAEWIADDGITVEAITTGTDYSTAWVAGGTHGRVYRLTSRVLTSVGRIDDRTIYLRVRER